MTIAEQPSRAVLNGRMKRSLKKRLRFRLRKAQGQLDTRWRRFLAYVDLVVFDLGVLRIPRPNWHAVSADVFRSAQPSPGLLRHAKRQGVKTVLNLRGADNSGSYKLEKRACKALGLRLVDLRLKSRDIPDVETLVELQSLLTSVQRPFLLHCKSGADRAGLVSALYLMMVEGKEADVALRQLHWRYGHIRQGLPGILTAFLEEYRDTGEASGLDIVTWRRTQCDPAAVRRRLHTNPLARMLTDGLFRRE